ncbi:hypothetical protein [Endozoicomonas sp. OPT23]|uniref:hypothetical protein n=1 Tax=Endozoicomonas sp. OPT23 TaxID=2072845 RepID=UPI00129AFA1C|nr:hypothetical protein [Endozoicomonas sp. OPT23]
MIDVAHQKKKYIVVASLCAWNIFLQSFMISAAQLPGFEIRNVYSPDQLGLFAGDRINDISASSDGSYLQVISSAHSSMIRLKLNTESSLYEVSSRYTDAKTTVTDGNEWILLENFNKPITSGFTDSGQFSFVQSSLGRSGTLVNCFQYTGNQWNHTCDNSVQRIAPNNLYDTCTLGDSLVETTLGRLSQSSITGEEYQRLSSEESYGGLEEGGFILNQIDKLVCSEDYLFALTTDRYTPLAVFDTEVFEPDTSVNEMLNAKLRELGIRRIWSGSWSEQHKQLALVSRKGLTFLAPQEGADSTKIDHHPIHFNELADVNQLKPAVKFVNSGGTLVLSDPDQLQLTVFVHDESQGWVVAERLNLVPDGSTIKNFFPTQDSILVLAGNQKHDYLIDFRRPVRTNVQDDNDADIAAGIVVPIVLAALIFIGIITGYTAKKH